MIIVCHRSESKRTIFYFVCVADKNGDGVGIVDGYVPAKDLIPKNPYRAFLWYLLVKYWENTNRYWTEIPNQDATLELTFLNSPKGFWRSLQRSHSFVNPNHLRPDYQPISALLLCICKAECLASSSQTFSPPPKKTQHEPIHWPAQQPDFWHAGSWRQ